MDTPGHGFAQDILTVDYMYLLGTVILYWDHILTFGDEVKYIWFRPKISSSYWFFLNRYIAFFGSIPLLVLTLATSNISVCKRYNTLYQSLFILNVARVCFLMSQRVYALYQRSRYILNTLTITSVIILVISTYAIVISLHDFFYTEFRGTQGQRIRCYIGITDKGAITLAIPWEALLGFESLVFTLTLWKSWTMRDHYRHVPLLKLLLRDGAMYYGIVCLSSLANILTFYVCGPYIRNGLVIFGGTISISMLSRIIINLHKSADENDSRREPQSTMQPRSYSGGDSNSDYHSAANARHRAMKHDVVELDTLATQELVFVTRRLDDIEEGEVEGAIRNPE
ncbi:hypothetical protein K435DRAFT_101806 [Dendrothele bispora CBS 962.96]|uniref:DUF6533 domain-containing protein n=1 Tax=Dendrothele bispora (strain CBS 962.96) TaxID=1314807 RepID=A0A4V6T5F3_DENBC|nr:hypothetical protein K435DRAFT_101806 [Dendrothele bispora CBS 962.96]